MTKLSDIQAAVLHAAIASDDETTTAPPESRAAVAGLIKRGFLISIPQTEGRSRLMITAKGREAVAPLAPADIEAPPEPAQPKASRPFAPLIAISLGPRQPVVKSEETAQPMDPPAPELPKGKIGALVGLLRQQGGTTIEAMMGATGWQAHSVRGAMSGAIKKGLGLNVVSAKTEAGRVYRIASGESA